MNAMQTLFAKNLFAKIFLPGQIREFSGSWADPAFVGLTLIYDHGERQMFRRSDEEEKEEEKEEEEEEEIKKKEEENMN